MAPIRDSTGTLLRSVRLIFTGALAAVTFCLGYAMITLPTGSEYLHTNPPTTSFIAYRVSQAAAAGRAYSPDMRWRPLSQISSHLQRAVLAGEDLSFYSHHGFDFSELWHAISDSYRHGRRLRGASTITQQLAKNLYLVPERTVWRKLRETIITVLLEKHLPKQRILELYLNTIEWGDGVFGAEAAAQHYFHRSAEQLSLSDAAFLAAIIPSPLGKYDPQRHPRSVRSRQATIEQRLRHQTNAL